MTFDHQEITAALKAWFRPGEVFEVRALEATTKQWNTRPHTEAGYFDLEHLPALLRSLDTLTAYKGIYVTLNPLTPAVLGRARYVFKHDKLIGAKDEEALCRRRLPIDCDAKRVSGVPSSEDEHAHALAKARDIRDGFASMGWPDPIFIDSGNGAQLLYRLPDLPPSSDLVKRTLEALQPYTDDTVEIDQTVFNPARIWRLPGTLNRKGDPCPEQLRHHRPCRILALPAADVVAPLHALEALMPRNDEVSKIIDISPFSLASFLARHFPNAKPTPYNGGTKWVLDLCPFNPDHNDRSAVITQTSEGRLGFVCHHNGCSGKTWHDLRTLLEPPAPLPDVSIDTTVILEKASVTGMEMTKSAPVAPPPTPVAFDPLLSLCELRGRFPKRSPAIIEGLLRERETANIIVSPKTGKTWLVMQLAVSIALGKIWMGRACTPKRVLAIDNELQPEEIVWRYSQVTEAMGVQFEELEGRLFTYPQRGNLHSINTLANMLETIREKHIEVIILDAFYRALPKGVDENSNTDIMELYNAIDRYAQSVNGAFILIHHTTKGSQVDKSVTDIGAGAGSQSRAADTHLVLLRHEHPGIVVLKGVARSFPPVKPTCLRQVFPLWYEAPNENPALLAGLSDRQRKKIIEGSQQPDISAVLAKAQPNPEGLLTEDSLPDLLRALGGQCTKTKFRDLVMQTFHFHNGKLNALSTPPSSKAKSSSRNIPATSPEKCVLSSTSNPVIAVVTIVATF